MKNTFRGELTVELEGKSYDVLMTMNAIYMMTKEAGVEMQDLDKLMQADQMGAMQALAYAGVCNAALRKGEEAPARELFYAMLMDDIDAFTDLIEAIIETLIPDTPKKGNGKSPRKTKK